MVRRTSYRYHSSLLVAPNVADDVRDILVAFFLVGNDGRIFIVTIIIFDGLVDLAVVLGLGNDSLISLSPTPTVTRAGAIMFGTENAGSQGGVSVGFPANPAAGKCRSPGTIASLAFSFARSFSTVVRVTSSSEVCKSLL